MRILIVAVGGQGNILAARVLGEAATVAGIEPRMSEFHGMAQRGGVVESMVIIGEGSGYSIADGEADVLLGFEPSETIRAAKKCSSQTVVITNLDPQPPFTVAMGKERYPDIHGSMTLLSDRVKRLVAVDAASLAAEAGSHMAVNMVMLGALARWGLTPITPDLFRRTIESTVKRLTEINLKAFDLGLERSTPFPSS